MVEEKCLINTNKGCILKDETAIVLTVSTATAAILFIAGSSLLLPLLNKADRG